MGEVKPEPNTQGEVKPEPTAIGRIVVTGANGFVGRACVAEARRRKLPVLALYRSQPDPAWSADAKIHGIKADLTDPELQGVLQDLPEDTAFIHTAGHMGDDPARLALDNISATAFMQTKPGQRFVLISSLSVYDTERMQPGDTMTEDSPLLEIPDNYVSNVTETIRTAASPYAMAKRLQEEAAPGEERISACWILRPGAIWGPGVTWHALQGFWASKLHVTIGSNGQLPLAHIDNVAHAAVSAATSPTTGRHILNVFDDDLPDRTRFLKAHKARFGWPKINATVPYGLWSALIKPLAPVAARLPGLFRGPVLRARMMPLNYSNTKLRETLGGAQPDFETLLEAAKEGSV